MISEIQLNILFDKLDINKNDWILLRISDNFFIQNKIKITYFYELLKKRISDNGLIIVLSFSNRNNISRSKGIYSATKTKSYCGLLSNYLINMEGALRTTHPTNSVIAVGKEKTLISKFHNYNSFSYDFMKPLIDKNAKMLNIDCDPISPGFTSVHFNEKILKLYKKSILNGLYRCKVKLDSGAIIKFKRKDFGLCSGSQNRFYKHYINNNKFNSGKALNSYFTSIKAGDAFEIENKILKNNSNFHTCNDLNCENCNIYRWDRLYRIPFYFIKKHTQWG